MRHPMLAWAAGRQWPFRAEQAGVLVMTERLLSQSTGLERWKVLERDPSWGTVWMVRDGWFQWPVVVLWRLSLAGWFMYRGLQGRAS